MDRINTASKAVDLFGAGKHGWKNANIGLGVTPTDFNAEWCNGVQEELLAIIEAGGQVPAIATRNQILLALRAAGVFTTPAQFDSTTKAATTAFAKLKGLEASGLTPITTSAAIGLAAVGGTVLFNAAGAIAPTLPAANTVPPGARIECLNINTGIATVTRTGADTIKVNSTTVTGLPVGGGDSLTLESDGVSVWYAVGGSAQLKYSSGFAAVLAVGGYQKLPSGLIIQWGQIGISASGGPTNGFYYGTAAVTFPLAFPNAVYAVLASPYDTAGVEGGASITTPNTAGCSIVTQTTSSGSAFAYWAAIGS